MPTGKQDVYAPSGLAGAIGIIDFGDMLRTCTVAEVAIASAYVMLEKPDPVAAAAHLVGGYHEAYPLTETELELLYSFIGMRLAMSVTIAAHQKQLEPENQYLTVSEQQAWMLLEKLRDVHPDFAHYAFRGACGLPPCPLHRIPKPSFTSDQTLEYRRQFIAPSLSLSYQQPLKIVHGSGQFLYADDGRPYLDCVNNVAHVGHCHPRVVQAVHVQMAALNTNTRYLHDNIVGYARRLCAKLPDPLSVCFFVNSGSEANDLALRLARAHSKGTDFIVVEGAYHGNLTSLIDISPYKFDGPGGSGAPAHVHKIPTPDAFRRAGADYIAELQPAIERVQASGKRIAAFIVESLMSCAGQIVLPSNYLAAAFRLVRSAGGVCIADEVQVGFGRVGTHFWGFETQGVVPDIVTMGKCIGNGHPLGAVVTTPEIAASFNNGMEYFNTYGGNPVSCAAGLAVLDVIEEENLQERALRVGAYLKAGLERLKDKHALVGDVRGLGLFLGIELVEDRESLAPASEQTVYAVERMKDRSILLSTDGPFHNVIKIKPPMVFRQSDADALVTGLDCVLSESQFTGFSKHS
jgi:4-aminobutyrate aminotransferase-like enzyme